MHPREQQIVVITGASAGVGRALVREWAGRGASLGRLARGVDGLDAAQREAQQTDEPVDPHRPDNLFEPVAGDRGAHGRFDDCSRRSSWQFWLSTHRTVTLVALGVVTALAGSSRR